MKTSIVLSIFLFFVGCSLSQEDKKPSPQEDKKVELKQGIKTPQTKQKTKQIISNMVRGVIYSQTYDSKKQVWVYELKVMDIASDVLKRKSFTYGKKLYDVGDLVYAIFDKHDLNRLKNLYLIKKRYENIKQKHIKKQPHKIKRTKSNQTPWIGVPKTETVMLK